jgi:hypothetical protein
MYLSAFRASSPRTAYSTSRTAGLILEVVRAGCLWFPFPLPLAFPLVDDMANDRIVQLGLVRGIQPSVEGVERRMMEKDILSIVIQFPRQVRSSRLSGRLSPAI